MAATILDGGSNTTTRALITILVKALKSAKGADAGEHKKVSKLKRRLQQAASKFWENRGTGSRLVIVIDELDRCRPDYAVRFMETVKHVFEVQYVTFVVAVNVEELAKAIKGAYGGTFDGPGYLERFFDIRLELPSGDRKQFIRKAVEQARLEQSFGKDIETGSGSPSSADILVFMLRHSDLNLREVK